MHDRPTTAPGDRANGDGLTARMRAARDYDPRDASDPRVLRNREREDAQAARGGYRLARDADDVPLPLADQPDLLRYMREQHAHAERMAKRERRQAHPHGRRPAPRRRGAGRPAGHTAARSSARSDDGSDDDEEDDFRRFSPADLPPAAIADARRVLARAARRMLAEQGFGT